MKLIKEPFTALGYGYQMHCADQTEFDFGCTECPFGKLITTDMMGQPAFSCAFGFIRAQMTDEQLAQFDKGIAIARGKN